MASFNGVPSPPLQQADTLTAHDDAILLSAKRKRDESIEAQSIVNGTTDSKDSEQTAPSAEESQSLVQDLVDVLKA